jgi:D-glycero-D-manno-heptose 1,7-bisphosphate phosphatase
LSEGRIGVFIDRDGTLNEERDFLGRPEDLQLVAGAGDAVRTLNRLGVVTCVISNQSGVARGFFSEADVALVHDALEKDLRSSGARLDRIYYCPHHPTEGITPYRVDCECRKPKPGMLRAAEREFAIDLSRSYVIGDKLDDVSAGRAVNATTILVLTGYGKMSQSMAANSGITPDLIVPSITEAVGYIADRMSVRQ